MAEQSGPLPGQRRIWLCADDYGIAPGVDRAIRDLVARGRLNATSVMVVSPHFSRAEAAALDAFNAASRRVTIGLHLTLTAPFKPLTQDFRPERDGAFLPLPVMLARGLLRALDSRALAAEVDAQCAAFSAAFGRPPDFVDGHQHVHLLPQVQSVVLDAVRRISPGAWVRQCGSPLPIGRLMAEDRKGLFLTWLSSGLRRRADALGIPTNLTFSGTYDFGPHARFADLFPRFLANQANGGLVMCHPGFVDDELRRLDPLTDLRVAEHSYFAGDQFPRDLAAAGVVLA